jgi:hypothetical protein
VSCTSSPDLAILEQHAETEFIHAAVVGDDGQIPHAHLADLGNEVFRNAAETESAGNQGHAVVESRQCLFETIDPLVKTSHVCRSGRIHAVSMARQSS